MKTKGRPRPKGKKQSSEYGRVRGAHMSRVRVELGLYEGVAYRRIIVETMEVLRREYEAKSYGCRDGKPNIGSKTRNANMILKAVSYTHLTLPTICSV